VYVAGYAQWVKCRVEIERVGLIVTNDKGMAMRNPLLKVSDDAQRTMLRCMSELGLTPSARVRLTGPVVDDDPLEAFLRGTK
jgi:P27 family predicted phage terminase small subunit